MNIEEWTEEKYQAALARIEALWGSDPDTDEGSELRKLVDRVEAWEDIHYPVRILAPTLENETLVAFCQSAGHCDDCGFHRCSEGVHACSMLRSQIVALHAWVHEWVDSDGSVKEGAPACPCWAFVAERRHVVERRQGARRRLVRPVAVHSVDEANRQMAMVLQSLLSAADEMQGAVVEDLAPELPQDALRRALKAWPERARERAAAMERILRAPSDREDLPTPPMADEGD
jgi:hypothetical protein